MFYVNNVKIVPKDLSLLTPLALAHWIMQDGSYTSSGGLYLCSDSFSLKDNKRLIIFLHNTYNLKVTLHKAPVKGQYRIYVWTSDIVLLKKIVLPYMHKTMLYKLGL